MKNVIALHVVPNSIRKGSALKIPVLDERFNCERKPLKKRSSPRLAEAGLPNIISIFDERPAFCGRAFLWEEPWPTSNGHCFS